MGACTVALAVVISITISVLHLLQTIPSLGVADSSNDGTTIGALK